MICTLCPRNCGVDRSVMKGFCKAPDFAVVHSAFLHRFEEPVISGSGKNRGSGTVFFSGCTMRCVYCQNKEISRSVEGKGYTPDELAELFLSLRDKGAYNINLVSPTPYVPYIISALDKAQPDIPVVYNTGGYENTSTVSMLSGYVDIWLTDFKYYDDSLGEKYSGVGNYRSTALSALRKMTEQCGSAKYITAEGEILMKSGVIVRHLCLPGHRKDTENVLRLLASELSPDTVTLSLMRQYTPDFAPEEYKNLRRRLTTFEYEYALELADSLGFSGFMQDEESAAVAYTPDFGKSGGEIGKNFDI